MEEKESLETRTPVGNMETESIPVKTGSVGGEILSPVMSTVGNTGVVQGVDSTGKKKRGRPRKYDSDGNLRVGYVKSPPSQIRTPPPGFTLSHSSDYTSTKKSRGRPPGSGNWQVLASLGELFALTAGGDFTPHVLNVYTGEDVAEKISSISQKGPRGICILAANGAVSNVTIRQPGSSGGILTYEGRFEILSLTGSFTISENGGVKSRTGGLSVSLAGPDGRVIGGGVAGLLMAASPIQIVVGSFVPNGFMLHKRKYQQEAVSPPNVISTPDVEASATPISQASHIVDNVVHSTTTQLPFHNHVGTDDKCMNENPKVVSSTGTADWNGAEPVFHPRVYPDINVSAPIE